MSCSTPHPISTQRLRLEPLVAEHAEEVAAAYLAAPLWAYFPRLRPADAAAVRARFARWSAGPPGDTPAIEVWENWVGFLHGTRTAVGTFQATIVRGEPASIAYLVFVDFQRRGFALEAMRAIVAHLRSDHGVQRVVAEMDERNAASIGIARRLGLREASRERVEDDRTGAKGIELRYEGAARATDGEGALSELRAAVARDAGLARRLHAIPPGRFVPETVAIAREAGIVLDESTLRAAIGSAQIAWRMRWIS